jgi:hypothetical protein
MTFRQSNQAKLFCLYEELYLNGNSIASIEHRSFNNLKELIKLDLSINFISNLSNFTLTGLIGLQTLNLSFNRIQVLQKGVFDDLDQIIELDLSSNVIMLIEKFTFFKMKNLRYLYLNRNPLRSLFTNGMFSGCESLKFIFISPQVEFDLTIYSSIKDDLKRDYVKEVLNTTYYSPFNIIISSENAKNAHYVEYTNEQCFYIVFLLKDKVLFNLQDDNDVTDFVTQCADHLFTIYKKL